MQAAPSAKKSKKNVPLLKEKRSTAPKPRAASAKAAPAPKPAPPAKAAASKATKAAALEHEEAGAPQAASKAPRKGAQGKTVNKRGGGQAGRRGAAGQQHKRSAETYKARPVLGLC